MKKFLEFLDFIIALILTVLVFTLPVMLLWNALMPVIFGLIKINFWQAFGLSLLCGFLFRNSNKSS